MQVNTPSTIYGEWACLLTQEETNIKKAHLTAPLESLNYYVSNSKNAYYFSTVAALTITFPTVLYRITFNVIFLLNVGGILGYFCYYFLIFIQFRLICKLFYKYDDILYKDVKKELLVSIREL